MKSTIIACMLGLILLFAACKKQEVSPAQTPSPTSNSARKGIDDKEDKKECKDEQILISGHNSKAWVIYKYVVGGVDSTSFLPTCALDNIIYLTKKGEYLDTEGPSKCDSSLSNIHNQGTYKLLCATNQINLVSTNLTTVMDILKLTPNQLVVEFFDPLKNLKVQFWLKPAF